MNTADPIQILDQQIAILNELQTLLTAEQNAIKSRDADKVTEISNQKAEQLGRLQANDKTLSSLLQSQTLTEEGEAKKRKVEELLTACKRDNEINGKAIHLSLASLARLQQQMSKQLGGDSQTYDGSGKASGATSRGTSLKA